MKRTPFFKVLVANRGEIALRVMRTARRLGYGVVAVYSDADRDALHVREADLRCGSAKRCRRSRICGSMRSSPPPRPAAPARCIRATASSPRTRILRRPAAMPGWCSSGRRRRRSGRWATRPAPRTSCRRRACLCVPGYQGADQSDAVMLAEAKKIGFPVMIKAVAGGGGRGMRLVADAAAFPDALRSARSEAQGAFGDPTVILERAIVDPRHIEIQVFGDRYGNAIHLGERDCSVQRRHQKLIEEAPSPKVTPELRARMGAVAVAAVKSIGYEGAGTLEFLLDPGGEFYFMEMNTRLQVEHPVTEAITGLDLVELQLRIAGGRAARAQAGGCQILRPCHRGAAVLGGCRP